MIAALALSLAMAAEPAAEPAHASATGKLPAQSTFCGRLVGPYRMQAQVFGKGTVYVTKLKGYKGRIGYSNEYDPATVNPAHLAEYKTPCVKTAFRIRCVMRGPGELTVHAGGAQSVWPIHQGEEAIVDYDYDGDRFACLDFRSE
jgi:hypothetical protein